MKRYLSGVLLAAVAIVSWTGCNRQPDYRIQPQTAIEPQIVRFDSLLLQYDTLTDTAQYRQMATGLAPFWGIYGQHILGLSDAPYFRNGIRRFLQDTAIAQLYTDTERSFTDLADEERQLAALTARYATLFPHRPAPVFQTHISGLNQSIVTVDSLVSVSLDCYLGKDYPLYGQRYNSYELGSHNRSRIVPDVGEVLLRNALPAPHMATLLDAMIYEGRILYLLAGLLDDNDAARLTGYTPEEIEWCIDNEANIWNAIVGSSHLFASDNMTLRKYIAPAPFTAPLSQDVPGRIGRWVGWRIIERYAGKTGMSPAQLAADTTSATDVLRLSHYTGK